MSGVVFHDIAEGIMAQDIKLSVTDARDSLSVLIPDVKAGNMLAAYNVLSHLGINTNKNWSGSYMDGNPIWGKAESTKKVVDLEKTAIYGKSRVPDVIGMGARDAVYLLESRGVKVTINGCGRVVEQSLPAGTVIRKGMKCSLKMKL